MAVTLDVFRFIRCAAPLAAAAIALGPVLAQAQGFTATIDLGSARANAAIGVAEKIVRDAFGGNHAYRLQPRQGVAFREQIDTGAASGAEIRFVDGTSLSLGENAEVKLDEFVFDPDRTLLKGSVNMLKGAMRFVGSTARKDIAIQTSAGTIGVRGTVFNLRVAGSASELEVISGEVQVTSGTARQDVRANEFVRISGGSIQRTAPPPAFRAALAQIAASLGPPTLATADTNPSGLAEIREPGGRLLAYTLTRADGRMDALDPNRRLVAYFDPASGATYAWNGRRLGPGNRVPELARGEH